MEPLLQSIPLNVLIQPNDCVLLALSGGADSMALLHLLLEDAERRSYTVHAIHFDHGLRPEATEEAHWVKQYCEKHGVPCVVESLDVCGHAKAYGTGLEGAGHELRKKALEKHRASIGADLIALAHHADDQAETILLHLVRGSGLKGLTGLAIQIGYTIRPLLGVRKRALLDYCHSKKIPYVTDASNADVRFRRNALRHQVMPVLEAMNPQVTESLCRTADILQADEAVLQDLTSIRFKDLADVHTYHVMLPREALCAEPVAMQRRLWQLALTALVPGHVLTYHQQTVLEHMLQSDATAKDIELGQNCHVWFTADACLVERHLPVLLQADPPVWLQDGDWQTMPQFKLQVERNVPYYPSPTADCLWLPFIHPLSVRNRQAGDVIRIQGLGRKSIKKLFQENALSPYQRQWWPLVCDAESGEILWIPGITQSQMVQPDEDTGKLGINIKMCIF